MNLERVDLNLFLVLDTVLTERSATRAASRLHVTQSAVSNALSRLRLVFDDALVVRSGQGLVATPKAKELAPIISAAISQLRGVVEVKAGFDPEDTTRRFTLVCTDYEEVVLLPALSELFAVRMPRASLRVVTMDYMLATNGLSTGDIDLVIGWPPLVPSGCTSEHLFSDDGVCVVRKDNPHVRGALTAEEFVSLPQIEVAVLGTKREVFDDAMPTGRDKRRVALSVPHFTIALLAAARTDYVATLPRRFVAALAGHLPVRILELPITMPTATISMVWHARTASDAGAQCVRELVRLAAKQVAPPPSRDVPNARKALRAKRRK